MADLKIKVGSKNPAKVEAVRDALQDYPHLKDATVEGIEVTSDIGDQPRSLEETVRGAITRAKGAFQDCTYSFGLEAGFMEVPYTKSGYMDTTACAIYDGKECHLGLSSSFETPDKEVMRLVMEENMTFNDAAHKAGLHQTTDNNQTLGVTGIVTKGRLDRKGFVQQAIVEALIHIDQ
jgi:inosine/xanthosine triphosphatase